MRTERAAASPTRNSALDLSKPMHLRAEIARAGLHSLTPWDSPDHGWTNPLNDPETQQAVRSFMARLWSACVEAESTQAATIPSTKSSTLVPNPTQDIYAYDVSEHDMSVDREIDRRLDK